MIKSFAALLKRDRERFSRIPRCVRDVLGIQCLWNNGTMRVGKDLYSRTFLFGDINFVASSEEVKESIVDKYGKLLNSLDVGEHIKITIHNRRINKRDFQRNILLPMKNDELDHFRQEYNEILLEKKSSGNDIIQDRYLTVTVHKQGIKEANDYFNRVAPEIIAQFAGLGSICMEMSLAERLRTAHDFFREGEESDFSLDVKSQMKLGHDVRDYICPDSFEFHSDYFMIGNRYARALFLRDYANNIKDNIVNELCSLNGSLMFSIDFVLARTDEAENEVEKKLLGIEKNIASWQQRQNANNNYSSKIPYDLELQRTMTTEILRDINEHDQRLFMVSITMVHVADTLEQLNSDTDSIVMMARGKMCQFANLKFQQMDGLLSTLPFGQHPIENYRTLTTNALSIFVPFKAQEICETNGIYYGCNTISHNLIIIDRLNQMNGNEFILGVPGSGKSVMAKSEIYIRWLTYMGLIDIIILDPESEYGRLVTALGGSVITLSAASQNHINAMDLNSYYGDGDDPIKAKSEFLLSLCEQLLDVKKLNPMDKSLIDRCAAKVYREYQQRGYEGDIPTLKDFREELLRQPEPLAKELALDIELFTEGSLNTFAHETNVDTSNNLICYDIHDLDKHLLPIGMLVVLDSILNRITRNRKKGVRTFIVIDEIYLMFNHDYTASFLQTLWKRVRKYGACCTGISQNASELLRSEIAKNMVSNSEMLIMMNQAQPDQTVLADLLHLSEDQLNYVSNVSSGKGLIKVKEGLIPFENTIPKDTDMYRLMTTRPGETV